MVRQLRALTALSEDLEDNFPAPECGSQPAVALGPLLAPLSIRHACDIDTCIQAGTHPNP